MTVRATLRELLSRGNWGGGEEGSGLVLGVSREGLKSLGGGERWLENLGRSRDRERGRRGGKEEEGRREREEQRAEEGGGEGKGVAQEEEEGHKASMVAEKKEAQEEGKKGQNPKKGAEREAEQAAETSGEKEGGGGNILCTCTQSEATSAFANWLSSNPWQWK